MGDAEFLLAVADLGVVLLDCQALGFQRVHHVVNDLAGDGRAEGGVVQALVHGDERIAVPAGQVPLRFKSRLEGYAH